MITFQHFYCLIYLFDSWCIFFPLTNKSHMQKAEDWPDQLEGVVDEAGPVVAAERRVIVFEQPDEVIPARALIVHNVISTHVHIKLDPVHFLRQIQHVYDDIYNRPVRIQRYTPKSFFFLFHSDPIQEPFWIPQRTFQWRTFFSIFPL